MKKYLLITLAVRAALSGVAQADSDDHAKPAAPAVDPITITASPYAGADARAGATSASTSSATSGANSSANAAGGAGGAGGSAGSTSAVTASTGGNSLTSITREIRQAVTGDSTGTNTTASCRYDMHAGLGSVLGGFSIGRAFSDKDCKRAAYAETLWRRGNVVAGNRVYCTIKDVHDALGDDCEALLNEQHPTAQPAQPAQPAQLAPPVAPAAIVSAVSSDGHGGNAEVPVTHAELDRAFKAAVSK